jgi:hypothetical protein
MWETLGIAATGDSAAIRRAYVARLRSIDVERDPAAFIRLREAYENALAAAARGDVWDDEPAEDAGDDTFWEDDPESEPADAEPVDVKPAERQSIVLRTDDREAAPRPLDRAEELEDEPDPDIAIDEALAGAGVPAAWRLFEHYMATGAVRLNEQADLVWKLVNAALHDTAPGAEATFRSILATVDAARAGREDDLAELRSEIAARRAAETWRDELERSARKRALGAKRFPVRGARVVLGEKSRYGQNRAQFDAIQKLLGEYRPHERWLALRLGGERLAALEQQLQRDRVRKARRDNIFVICVIALFALDFLWVILFGRD